MRTLAEIVAFLAQRKRWWLVPVIVLLLCIGFLLVLGTASPLSPFIYTLF